MKNKDLKIGIFTDTRKLTKILDIAAKYIKAASEDFKKMDMQGCQNCGSLDYEILHKIENVGNHDYLLDGRCLECNHLYVKDEHNNVELTNRK